ncbi:MAG TPA: SLBB domain-containing protein, partial [Rhizomicrobium sp.]|nr:SLBB domain-containing protein [Rhizomicrobium sp.]
MSERAGQPLRQFGYAFFGHGAPVIASQSGALQDNYVLGQGDEIVLTLRGQENSSFRTRVDRDGRVVLPTLPPVAAAGRSFGAFRADVEAAARRALPGTQALVSVGEVRQISVRVAGEVNNPGMYYATGLSTAMDVLSLAGGVKNTGSLRDIQIMRGARVMHVDLYALLAGGAGSTDITLTEGDRVVVPLETSAVGVVGQVKRPAIYELPPGRSGVPVSELLSLSGGPEVRGNYRLSILKTRDDGKREMVQ